jgi:hypothetical protein
LRWSAGLRVWVAFGLAAALFTAAVLAEMWTDETAEALRWTALLPGACAIAGAALAAGFRVRAAPSYTYCIARAWWPPMILSALLLTAGLLALGRARGAAVLMASWLLPVALANFTVNPMIRSSKLFPKGPGHEVVDRALAWAPGRLIDYRTHAGAVLSAFGWPVLTGVQEVPDLALLRFLAPDAPQLTEEMVNRYAHYTAIFPPEPSTLLQGDAFELSISPCSGRLAAVGVNHFLVPASATPPAECAQDLLAVPAGELQLWSRRSPVCAVGVASGVPASALDFDYACRVKDGARFEPGVLGFTFTAPPDASKTWAVALNPAVVDSVECAGATARFLDAHLVVHPEGGPAATCRGHYLDTAGALRRMLRRSAP